MENNIQNSTKYEKISEWLDIYHSSDSEPIKAKIKALIVAQMVPVVKHIARTIARRATDPIEDMVQAGCIGLLKAIDHYSKEKNDNFRVYAGYLIIGEMKHYLRDKLNTIRVPRHIQELSVRISNFTKTLTPEELEELTNEDVASALQISTKAVDFAMQMDRRRSTISLEDVFSEDDSLGYEELLTKKEYKNAAEIADAKIIFSEVAQKLPVESRLFLKMYYNEDLNQREIAERLKLSPMAVSRKLKKIFSELYSLIEKESGKNLIDGESDES